MIELKKIRECFLFLMRELSTFLTKTSELTEVPKTIIAQFLFILQFEIVFYLVTSAEIQILESIDRSQSLYRK